MFLIGVLIVIIMLYNVDPVFGKRPNKTDQQNYAQRSHNYENGKFFYDDHLDQDQKFSMHAKNVLSNKGKRPHSPLPTNQPDFSHSHELSFTWFGHSTLLIQIKDKTILIDPIFSTYPTPLPLGLFKRFDRPVIAIKDLPEIDFCLISHNHYDHLDYPSIKKLKDKVHHFIVPLGVEKTLESWHISKSKIINMAWGEEVKIEGITFGAQPSRHFSQRSLFDRNETLWCSYVIETSSHRIFIGGDSGFGHHFEEIQKRYHSFDIVFLECAQYDGRWMNIHMFPEDALKVAKILNARYLVPMHFGAYSLSVHPWDDPLVRLNEKKSGIPVITPLIGTTVDIKDILAYQEHWWEDIE